jgi:hypothetical protein
VKRLIAEWLWRAALVGALCWIGWELMLLHEDLRPAPDDQTTAEAADGTQDSLDGIAEQLEDLTQKVNAILVVLAGTR